MKFLIVIAALLAIGGNAEMAYAGGGESGKGTNGHEGNDGAKGRGGNNQGDRGSN